MFYSSTKSPIAVKTPYKLQSGETCAFWGNYTDITKKIGRPKFRRKLKVRAYTSDYLGNTFRSNWFTIKFEDRWYNPMFAKIKSWRQSLLKLIWL